MAKVLGNSVQLFSTTVNTTVTMTQLTLKNGYIPFNSGAGGAINNKGNLTLNRTTISNNTALIGAGIYNSGTLTVNNSSLISNNTSSGGIGGAVVNDSLMTINNTNISANTADIGSGILNRATMTVNATTVANNLSHGNGGGFYNTGTLTINTSSITGNSASFAGSSGGGFYNVSTLTINRSTVANNTAAQSGGGIYSGITNLSSMVVVNDSTIAKNTATSGGGLYNDLGSTTTLNNTTVAENTANQGGGLYSSSGFAVLQLNSNLIAINTLTGASPSGPDVNGPITSYGNNLVGNGVASSGWTTTGSYLDLVGNAFRSINPKLNTFGYYGGYTQAYELLPGSPAIGGGYSSNSLSNPISGIDQRGVGRKNSGNGTGCDIGAFESYSFSPASLPPMPVNTYASFNLAASGGIAPYFYTISSGTLPVGMTLASVGTLYGTPTKGGVYTFNVFVSDSLGNQDLGAYSLNVIGAKDTIGVFRPSAGTFFLRRSNTTGYADYTLPFGNANSLPIAGDWNGDGIDTVGYADSTTGSFALTNGTLPNSSVDYTLTFGNPGDRPFSGHWSIISAADGVGVYRGTNGILYIKSALVTGFADYAMVLGNPGDLPVAGDWTGKGFDSIGIYRSGASSFYLSNKLINGNITADITVPFGSGPALPIAGDWTGSGFASLALYNNGVFITKNYPYSGSTPDNTFAFGAAGDLPVAGMWAQGNGNTANPVHTAPPTILVPKTATPLAPSGSNGSAPGGNQIGG